MELETILGKYSEEYDIDVAALKTKYDEIHSKLSDTNEKIRQQKALTKLTNDIKREEGISQKTSNYEGIILSAPPPIDGVALSIEIAGKIFTKNPARALEEHYTNEEGTPLDRRKWAKGRENANMYGILDPSEEDWRRTITGICKKEGDLNYKMFSLRFYGDKAKNGGDLAVLKPVKFAAIEKKVDAKKVQMNASKHTKFDETNESMDLESILTGLGELTPLKDVQLWYDMNKKDKNAIMITEGSVYRVRREPNDNQRRSVTLTEVEEPDVAQSFSVPEGIALDFDEDSRVIIFGVPKPVGDGSRLWVDTLGVYPLPDYLIPFEERESETETEPVLGSDTSTSSEEDPSKYTTNNPGTTTL